jgi:hypothetical protein
MDWIASLWKAASAKPAPDYGFTAKPERGKHAHDEPKGFIGGPRWDFDITPNGMISRST